jgi:broad specificity phosphatase PhoE
MTLVYLVQHGDKLRVPGDPGLTSLGRRQAGQAGAWLQTQGIRAVYASPLRRARETADRIGEQADLPVIIDGRLRERLNWTGGEPFEDFLDRWARTEQDRDYEPAGGDSSRQAAGRLRDFLTGLAGQPGPVAAVTHGGVTADLLRTLLGDAAVPPGLRETGIPSCAITAVTDATRLSLIASVTHLAGPGGWLPGPARAEQNRPSRP